MRKTALIIILALLCTVSAFCQNLEYKKAKIICGPYLQCVSETEFTVVWMTDVDATAWVEVAPDDDTHFYNCQRQSFHASALGVKNIGTIHRVRVTGLKKGTSYRYRIMNRAVLINEPYKVLLSNGSGSAVYGADPYKVTTLDNSKSQIRFSVVNDIHANDSTFNRLMKDVDYSKTDFVVFNGDMTSDLRGVEKLQASYLGTASKLFSPCTPIFFSRGNHETRGPGAPRYTEFYPTPTGRTYYTFRHGPVFFIVLDGGEDKPDDDVEYQGLSDFDNYRREEAEWLKGVVESKEYKEAPVHIVFCHVPPSATGWHGDREVSELFIPILDKADVNLMLTGHLHRYELRKAGTDAKFPIIVNKNLERMDITATASEISVKIYNADGKLQHDLKF